MFLSPVLTLNPSEQNAYTTLVIVESHVEVAIDLTLLRQTDLTGCIVDVVTFVLQIKII